MKDMGDEAFWKASVQSYELPQPPPDLQQKVRAQIHQDQQRRRLLRKYTRVFTPLGFMGIILILLLAIWEPWQATIEGFCRWFVSSMPTDLTGLIWYSSIWIGIGVAFFALTLLVISGLRFLEE
jgi:hypothetical protein